ncbi:ribokinase [Halomonas sp. TRM85114]|uniref:ribokinase n=1 Tax=Halomonas jincaotanensis TaxID=2810616 RepID=UPI001BD2CA9B|nr:ribokinase [Halomonas jincaotanensis]MBS9402609.1 ribokinase [Halomonas jincaotanensis]
MLYNLGSINLDHFYRVAHFVTPGETLASHDYRIGLGGKGANQSLALARAGAAIAHWGRVGRQDGWARDLLAEAGIDVSRVELVEEPSGHAIIQVDDQGENAILLFAGANHGFLSSNLDDAISSTQSGDWLLVQNECNALSHQMTQASAHGLNIAFNPAPMTDEVLSLPLEHCRLLFVNRGEAARLVELPESTAAEALLEALASKLPATETVLTLGSEGAWRQRGDERQYQPALPVTAVDTTAAGDTFIGYYLAALQEGRSVTDCLHRATIAAGLSVQRHGATDSIPHFAQVEEALQRASPSG